MVLLNTNKIPNYGGLLRIKLNKMDNEKILLDALNKFGNFISVEQEFNNNQLEVIYEAMNQVLLIASVVGRSEQLRCGRNITTCLFYKDGGKCSNPEYCRDQTT